MDLDLEKQHYLEVCNLLKFDEGKIFIDDEKIFPKENFYISNLGYIRQQIYLLNDTIQKNIIFGENLKNCNNEKIKDRCRRCNCIS